MMSRVEKDRFWASFIYRLLPCWLFMLLVSLTDPVDAVTCASTSFTQTSCSAGTVLKNGQDTITCAASTCTSSECCQAFWAVAVSSTPFAGRRGTVVFVFKGSMYLTCGYNDVTGLFHDIWSAPDGLAWTQVTTTGTIFGGRHSPGVVVLNDKIILTGGNTVGNGLNDIWISADAISWTSSTSTRWAGRGNHVAAVFLGKVFIGTGYQSSTVYHNDFYSSPNGTGTSWTTETANGGFTARAFASMVVHRNALWLMGGSTTAPAYLGDIQKSIDGKIWVQVTPTGTSFTARELFGATVFGNKIWVIGGRNGAALNTAYTSPDGLAWRQETISFPDNRCFLDLVIYADKMWALGGWDNSVHSTRILTTDAPKCTLQDPGYTTTGCSGTVSAANCTPSCVTGYTGSPMAYCASAGAAFTFNPTCVPMCTLPALGAQYVVSGCTGTITVAACTLSCATGYGGTPTAVCSSPGTFTISGSCAALPKCGDGPFLQSQCPSGSVLKNDQSTIFYSLLEGHFKPVSNGMLAACWKVISNRFEMGC